MSKQWKGKWRVVRDCCTSGGCVNCRHRPVGTRVKVVHGTGYSKARALVIASNWSSYKAKAELTPVKSDEQVKRELSRVFFGAFGG